MRIATILMTAILCFGWQQVAADGDWISAVWTDSGDILLTCAKYRGLVLLNEEGTSTEITDGWKAGYRPDTYADLVAFTGTDDFDNPPCLGIYNTLTGKSSALSCLDGLGPPAFDGVGNIIFSDAEETFVMAQDGELVESFNGGAYIVVPVENGFFWCDRDGRAWHRADGNVNPVELPIPDGFVFSPTVSDDGRYVLIEDRGGAVLLYDVRNMVTHILPDGDRPIFTANGILQLQLSDDGHSITGCSILYTPLDDGIKGNSEYVLDDLWPLLIVQMDFHPERGLVMTTTDGRVIEEVFDR